ncbi:hypothetical protein RDWZM_000288, partial [Blomia tropicalis]
MVDSALSSIISLSTSSSSTSFTERCGAGNRFISPNTVTIKYGTLQGLFLKLSPSSGSVNTRLSPIEAFLGVPYASPPTGALRFMPPVTPAHWRGIRTAHHLGPLCPQKLPYNDLLLHNSTEALKRMPLGRIRRTTNEIKPNVLNDQPANVNNDDEDDLTVENDDNNDAVDEQRRHHRHRNVNGDSLESEPSISTSSTNKEYQQRRQRANLPVIVILVGDSYDWNIGSLYDGSILASFGQVVVVTLNFRLGLFGFLPANVDGTIRGNYGLMDQVAALHWIQENIGEFGGSPSNITIVGHGHGAACAHLLMLSPMAKGLFNRVVLMSGSSLSPWAIARDASTYAKEIGRQLNCPLTENALMVDCLRTKTVDELLSVTLRVPDYLSAFGPIVDGIVVPLEPRIQLHNLRQHEQQPQQYPASRHVTGTQQPSAISNGYVHHRLSHIKNSIIQPTWSPDLMAGVTRVEAPPIFSSHEERNGITIARRDRLVRTLVRNSFDYHQQAIFHTLVNEYTDWTRPVEHPINLMDSLVELLGDALVVSPMVEVLDNQHSSRSSSFSLPSGMTTTTATKHNERISSSTSRAFFYVFAHQVSSSMPYSMNLLLGCSHGDELSYLFGVPLLWDSYHIAFSASSFDCDKQPPSEPSMWEMDHKNPIFKQVWSLPTLDISSSTHYPFSSTSTSSVPFSTLNFTQADVNQSKLMITYWVNFAAHGDPNVFWRDSSTSNVGQNESSLPQEESHPRRYHHHRGSSSQGRAYTELQLANRLPSTIASTSISYQMEHLHQLNRLQYEHVHNTRLDTVLWPTYHLSHRKYLHFGSKVKVREHYHSHRLSIWLSLIPRLHQPLSKLYSSSKSSDYGLNESDLSSTLDSDQYFYLRHHVLSDHENMETYDGIVKPLSIAIPNSKQWQRKHMRPNMTNIYEQHYQQQMYEKISSISAGKIENRLVDLGLSNGQQQETNQIFDSNGNEQFAGRRSEDENSNNNMNPDLVSNGENNFIEGEQQPESSDTSASTPISTNDLHYEAQTTNDTYSTALLVTIVVGCSLLVLNVLIFLGVYYQLDRKDSSSMAIDNESTFEHESPSPHHQHDQHFTQSSNAVRVSSNLRRLTSHRYSCPTENVSTNYDDCFGR